jgi:hypothetical protein
MRLSRHRYRNEWLDNANGFSKSRRLYPSLCLSRAAPVAADPAFSSCRRIRHPVRQHPPSGQTTRMVVRASSRSPSISRHATGEAASKTLSRRAAAAPADRHGCLRAGIWRVSGSTRGLDTAGPALESFRRSGDSSHCYGLTRRACGKSRYNAAQNADLHN